MPDSISSPAIRRQEVSVASIPLSLIFADPKQVRRHFDEDALQELAASIADLGLIQPIVVRPRTVVEGEALDYEIVSGERRWRACGLAGLDNARCEVRHDLNTADVAAIQLVENLQRENLSLAETVQGCASLVDLIGLEAAAARLSKSKAWVSQRATVRKLSERVQQLIAEGKLEDIEVAHGIDTIAALDAEEADDFYRQILSPSLFDAPITRELVREKIAELKSQAKRQAEHDERMAREAALREAANQKAKAAQKGLPLDDAAAQVVAAPKPPKKESPHEREQRLRAEAWIALEPDMRRLTRECRKLVIGALEECADRADPNAFELTIGLRHNYTAYDAPAKAEGTEYRVEIKGGSDDAGLILDALTPQHRIGVHIRPTIAQLRQIEAILGEQLPIREAIAPKGAALRNADMLIRHAHAALTAPKAAAAEPAGASEGIGAFLKACTQCRKGARVKASDLHAAYTAYCERHGFEPMPLDGLADNNFGAAIAAAGIEKIRSNGFRYTDIELLVAGDDQ